MASPGNIPVPVLLSVDLEDVRSMIPNGHQFADRIARNVDQIVSTLSAFNVRCTFFVTGDIARRYPRLVSDIQACGHEIACHSDGHAPLEHLDPREFREDLQRNLEALHRAGIDSVVGYRAPTLSMTPATTWAYEVLASLGFTYSSSVLPSRNPLFGWPGHRRRPVWRAEGVWEIPVSLTDIPLLDVPYASGVYFRVLPYTIIKLCWRRHLARGHAIVGYLHLHDFDEGQEHFMHPGLNDSVVLNGLMYLNRKRALPRLTGLLQASDAPVWTFQRFECALSQLADSGSTDPCAPA